MTHQIEVHSATETPLYYVGYKDATNTSRYKTLSKAQTDKILNKRQREGLTRGKFRFTITEQHYNLLVSY